MEKFDESQGKLEKYIKKYFTWLSQRNEI